MAETANHRAVSRDIVSITAEGADLHLPASGRLVYRDRHGHHIGFQVGPAGAAVQNVRALVPDFSFTQALVAADFELETADKDAVIELAIETSGYRSARSRLFPS